MAKFTDKKIVIFLVVFLSFAFFIGCSSTVTESGEKSHKATYSGEQQDLMEKIRNNPGVFSLSLPKDYVLSSSVKLLMESDANRIDYQIKVDSAKISMENLIMSFNLDPTMFNKLNTSSVFQSNTQNDFSITVAPTGDTLGATLGRAFILDDNKVDEEMLRILKTIYVKLTYNLNGEKKQEYYKLQADVSNELQDYLKSKIKK